MLPPSLIAGVSVLCAAGAWLSAQPVMLRGLTAVAAASTVVGSAVMRRWDTVAGKRVAELGRARTSDGWRYEERLAEVEGDLDESRAVRAKMEAKLRSKRAELAALRGEHASLLRRYATAETERASALEGRRLLAIEATTPAKALPPGGAASGARGLSAAEPAGSARPTPELYERAGAALGRLTTRTVAASVASAAPVATAAPAPPVAPAAPAAPVAPAAPAVPAAPASPVGKTAPAASAAPVAPALPAASKASSAGGGGHSHAPAVRPESRGYRVPAASAVAPRPAARRPAVGGFDFFGTQGGVAQGGGTQGGQGARRAAPRAIEAVQNEDLADVVGEEALAVHRAQNEAAEPAEPTASTEPTEPAEELALTAVAAGTPAEQATPQRRTEERKAATGGGADGTEAGEFESPAESSEDRSGQVIDLTEHDETEQLDVERLRAAMRA
ncbi:hypothetical protein [Streptomyces tsukubensis]|nr:hypothetical protein [Streptomyces tsukubensis]